MLIEHYCLKISLVDHGVTHKSPLIHYIALPEPFIYNYFKKIIIIIIKEILIQANNAMTKLILHPRFYLLHWRTLQGNSTRTIRGVLVGKELQ